MCRLRCLSAAVLVFAAAAPHASAADYDVTASGRCVYEEGGVLNPIPGALVELRDQNFGAPTQTDVAGPFLLDVAINKKCGEAVTGADGRFTIRARCGDFGPGWLPWSKPDLYVRCALVGRAGRVLAPAAPFTVYAAATKPRRDSAAPLNAGDVRVDAGAAKTFVSLNRTYASVAPRLGAKLEPVWVRYPAGVRAVVLNSDQEYFASYAGAVFIAIAPGAEGGTVAHEYGHTLQFQSFLQDLGAAKTLYNLARAGWAAMHTKSGSGHTIYTMSDPVMAFSEGFAEFMEGVVYEHVGYGPSWCIGWTERGRDEQERMSVEGNIACRLMRLNIKYGLREIWRAMIASRAMRFDHFLQAFSRLHPEAGPVAFGTPAPLVAAARPAPLVASVSPATAASPKTSIATTLAGRLGASPALAATLQKAEGAACATMRATFAAQSKFMRAVCASRLLDPQRRRRCATRQARIDRRVAALGQLCR